MRFLNKSFFGPLIILLLLPVIAAVNLAASHGNSEIVTKKKFIEQIAAHFKIDEKAITRGKKISLESPVPFSYALSELCLRGNWVQKITYKNCLAWAKKSGYLDPPFPSKISRKGKLTQRDVDVLLSRMASTAAHTNVSVQKTPGTPEKIPSPAQPVPVIQPKTTEGSATSLSSQFAALEKELSRIKGSGLYLATEHAARLNSDLDGLHRSGYSSQEIERLRAVVLTLSLPLQKQQTVPVPSTVPSSPTGASSSTAPVPSTVPSSPTGASSSTAPVPSTGPSSSTAPASPAVLSTPSYPRSPSGWDPPRGCSGDQVAFTASPVDENTIKYITPLGRMWGGHVTPTDHGYINTGQGVTASVRSPAAGEIVHINTFPRPNDFLMVIWHSCTISTMYIHLTDLAPEVRNHVGDLQPGAHWYGNATNPLRIAAGQVIGSMRFSVDFSVQNTNIILPGFVIPSHYTEASKIHTADLFNYFAEPLRGALRAKSERTVEPVGGKIDYDIDGRLVGNWFVEGTGGYSSGPGEYWRTHLAIAYDHIFPDIVLISIANSGINDAVVCNVCGNVYGVKGNRPNPADVNVATGLVKYELVARRHITDPRTGANVTVVDESKTLGVFLAQMLADRRIKVEVFAGKNASEVSGFTGSARIYER